MLLQEAGTGQYCWKGLAQPLDCGQCWSVLLLVKQSSEVPNTNAPSLNEEALLESVGREGIT